MVARGAHNPEVTRSKRVAATVVFFFLFYPASQTRGGGTRLHFQNGQYDAKLLENVGHGFEPEEIHYFSFFSQILDVLFYINEWTKIKSIDQIFPSSLNG